MLRAVEPVDIRDAARRDDDGVRRLGERTSNERRNRRQLALDVCKRAFILPSLYSVMRAFDEYVILGKREDTVHLDDLLDEICRADGLYDKLPFLRVAVIN
jgi:hypothetical protein